jgi:biopolymer transport protein ExbD
MARKKREEIKVEEANVLPVMNIMFLLIPALLLAMEVASMAAISVSPPKFSAAPSEKKEEKKKDEKQLKLKIFIMEDGFRVSAADQQEGAEAGKSADSNSPSIPLTRDAAGCVKVETALFGGAQRSGCYDFAALEAKATEYQAGYPPESIVTLSAENTIPMQILISTMDAMRGTDCKTPPAGEDVPAECYFYTPIVEAGAG